MKNQQDNKAFGADFGGSYETVGAPPVETGNVTGKASDVLLTEGLPWRVNTLGLLNEILNANPTTYILAKPINIFGKLLAMVGERAAELDDPKLNALMCRLAIYSVSDPNNPDYDEDVVRAALALAEAGQ